MSNEQTIKKIQTAINESNNILLISHRNPDGDTIGSSLALAHYLDTLSKKYTLYCQNQPPTFFSFLSKFELLQTGKEPDFKKYDLIITADCADQAQTGVSPKTWPLITAPIINIDHHLTNSNFGHHNLIIPDSASTTAILYHFFNQVGASFTRPIATCLLTGLITDTSNFSNPSTNQDALEVASRLVAKGAQIRYINHHVIKNKSLPILKLWSRIFLRLRKNEELGLAWTVITLKDKQECDVDDLATEGISNFFNELSDSNFSLVLEEIESGYVKGSLRTTTDFIDVSKFAKIMGGGGHQKSAGFRIKGQLQETRSGWAIV